MQRVVRQRGLSVQVAVPRRAGLPFGSDVFAQRRVIPRWLLRRDGGEICGSSSVLPSTGGSRLMWSVEGSGEPVSSLMRYIRRFWRDLVRLSTI